MQKSKRKAAFAASLGLLLLPCFAHAVQRQRLDLTLSRAGDFIVVTLINRSDMDLRSPGLFLTANTGPEGLYLSFLDSKGKRHSLCAMVDQIYIGNYVVPPRGFLQKNLNIDTLKRMFCLKAGHYDLTAEFMSKDLGSAAASFSITFEPEN
jgi:hypothetical protein